MYKTLNNCDELINFVLNELNSYDCEELEFQGDSCEVTLTTLDYIEIGIIKENCLITISSSAEGGFDVHCIEGLVHFDRQYPCVVVPDYVKDELIETLKGNY